MKGGVTIASGLIALGLSAAACSSPSAQQTFLNDVKSAGVTGMGTNQELLRTGQTDCHALAKGIKFVALDQYLQLSSSGIREANGVIVAVKAVQDLCPKYQSEVPTGRVRTTPPST
jgi:hypothetical protein